VAYVDNVVIVGTRLQDVKKYLYHWSSNKIIRNKLYALSMSGVYFVRFVKVIFLLSPYEVFKRAKEERLLLKILKNRRH
jgi:hypothetical protein